MKMSSRWAALLLGSEQVEFNLHVPMGTIVSVRGEIQVGSSCHVKLNPGDLMGLKYEMGRVLLICNVLYSVVSTEESCYYTFQM